MVSRSVFASLVAALLAGVALAQTDTERINCLPDGTDDQDLCETRGCVYEEASTSGAPSCYFPSYYTYSLSGDVEETTSGMSATLVRNSELADVTFVGDDFDELLLTVEFQTDERLRIKIEPVDEERFEVPLEISGSSGTADSALYAVTIEQGDNGVIIQVTRKSTGTIIFDTSLGGIVFENQFIQISTKLGATNIYGLGENEQSQYKHDLEWKTWTGFARDQFPDYDANMYGVHPTYTAVEDDGNAHGVLFLNSNAQEWSFTPDPMFIYRTIGGLLDMYFFLGPTPSNVNSQYSEAVGRFYIPPYWSLGFQICSFGYQDLGDMQEVVNRTALAEVPQDVQWGDSYIMIGDMDFTLDPKNFSELPEYVDQIKEEGVRFVTILDPGIASEQEAGTYRPYDLGEEMDVWVKDANGKTVQGIVWPEDPVVYADFTNEDTKEWWITNCVELHDTVAYDGLWIDMNEPSNFVNGDLEDGCEDNTYNNPPYLPPIRSGDITNNSLCADHVHAIGIHYDVHSLYGWSEQDCTLEAVETALPGSRGWVLSRSTFVGSGKWTAHWLGDNFSNWANLKNSIIGVLQFNRFAIPHVGADICGFYLEAEEELCTRWHQAGAFYPFSRNHNVRDNKEQDPAVWGDEIATIIKEALQIRYRFLPYMYTLFYKHSTAGESVARALWDEFPTDASALVIDEQFLLGPALMIAPVLEAGAVSVNAYFPDARWYQVNNWIRKDEIIERSERGILGVVEAPFEEIPVFTRGGFVFATQLEARNTMLARQNNWRLLVTLDDDDAATGELFLDDGESYDTVGNGEYLLVDFAFADGVLTSSIAFDGFEVPDNFNMVIEGIDIVGISSTVSDVTVDGESVFDFEFSDGRLTIDNLELQINAEFEVAFV